MAGIWRGVVAAMYEDVRGDYYRLRYFARWCRSSVRCQARARTRGLCSVRRCDRLRHGRAGRTAAYTVESGSYCRIARERVRVWYRSSDWTTREIAESCSFARVPRSGRGTACSSHKSAGSWVHLNGLRWRKRPSGRRSRCTPNDVAPADPD